MTEHTAMGRVWVVEEKQPCQICGEMDSLTACELCGRKVCEEDIVRQKISEDDFMDICKECGEK